MLFESAFWARRTTSSREALQARVSYRTIAWSGKITGAQEQLPTTELPSGLEACPGHRTAVAFLLPIGQ